MSLWAAVERHFGAVDAIVNNAGIAVESDLGKAPAIVLLALNLSILWFFGGSLVRFGLSRRAAA